MRFAPTEGCAKTASAPSTGPMVSAPSIRAICEEYRPPSTRGHRFKRSRSLLVTAADS
jgi:hypothetical protein